MQHLKFVLNCLLSSFKNQVHFQSHYSLCTVNGKSMQWCYKTFRTFMWSQLSMFTMNSLWVFPVDLSVLLHPDLQQLDVSKITKDFFSLFLVGIKKPNSSDRSSHQASRSTNEQDLFPETFATISWMSLSRDILAFALKET